MGIEKEEKSGSQNGWLLMDGTNQERTQNDRANELNWSQPSYWIRI